MGRATGSADTGTISYEATAADRRVQRRKSLSVPARIRVVGAGQLDAYTIDLSAGGVSVTAPLQFNAGQECVVEIGTGRTELVQPLCLEATVCYCIRVAPGSFRTGMQFKGLTSEATQRLAALLR